MPENKRDQQRWGLSPRPFGHRAESTVTPGLVIRGSDIINQILLIAGRIIPNVHTVDDLACDLARYTPRTTAICLLLLFAGIVASRLDLWVEGFLWGIPSLGAISIGVGVWIWSRHIFLFPALSPAARNALHRAMYFQIAIIVAGFLGLVYFIGMGMHYW